MASVTKRGNTWSIRYRVTDALGNVSQPRIGGYPTKEAAWEDVRRLEAASNAGADIHGDRQSVGYIIERWFSEHVLASTAVTTASKYRYSADIIAELPIYNMPVRKLSPLSYSQFLEALRTFRPGKVLSARTVLAYAEPIRLSISWAASQGILARDPIYGYRWITAQENDPSQQLILEDGDIAELDRFSLNKQFRVPLILVLYGGLRKEETAALQWPMVDFQRGGVHIVRATTRTHDGQIIEKGVKTKASARFVTFPPSIMAELKMAYDRRKSDYVAVTRAGERYALDSYCQAIERMITQINGRREKERRKTMPTPTYHKLRHTHAAMLIRQGEQAKVIQERFGHASIKITMDLYGYLMVGMQEGPARSLEDYRSNILGISSTSQRAQVGTEMGTRTRVFTIKSVRVRRVSENQSTKNA